jgi:hypothetical protein
MGRGDRKGGLVGGPAQSGQTGEGTSPSSPLQHIDAPSPSKYRSVEDGFTPSPDRADGLALGRPYPPLRSPGPHHATSPRFAPMGASPVPTR